MAGLLIFVISTFFLFLSLPSRGSSVGNNWNRSVKRVSAIEKVGVAAARVVKLDTDWEWREREDRKGGRKREREE